MIALENISKRFDGFSLHGITLDVGEGEYFVMLGQSGVGKSLILEIIAGLTAPDGGRVSIDGSDITHKPIQQRNVGLVYQDQTLFPHMTVRKNLEFPLKCRGMKQADIDRELSALADKTGVIQLLARMPETLSIGEAQRTALARTLATQPKVLLLDEPLASLDVQAKAKMRAFLRKINQEKRTIIHVTHDYEEAFALADRIAVLEKGTVSQVGTPEEIFQRPKSEFIAHFIGIRNFYKGTLTRKSEDLAAFAVASLVFEVTTGAAAGTGCLTIDSRNVTVSKTPSKSSARNWFEGRISDIEPARLGVDIHVDIGVPMTALVTRESLEQMALAIGDTVWLNFKASSIEYLSD